MLCFQVASFVHAAPPLIARDVFFAGEERPSFCAATFSFLSSNDGAFGDLSLLIKHLFIAKEDARSVALYDWA